VIALDEARSCFTNACDILVLDTALGLARGRTLRHGGSRPLRLRRWRRRRRHTTGAPEQTVVERPSTRRGLTAWASTPLGRHPGESSPPLIPTGEVSSQQRSRAGPGPATPFRPTRWLTRESSTGRPSRPPSRRAELGEATTSTRRGRPRVELDAEVEPPADPGDGSPSGSPTRTTAELTGCSPMVRPRRAARVPFTTETVTGFATGQQIEPTFGFTDPARLPNWTRFSIRVPLRTTRSPSRSGGMSCGRYGASRRSASRPDDDRSARRVSRLRHRRRTGSSCRSAGPIRQPQPLSTRSCATPRPCVRLHRSGDDRRAGLALRGSVGAGSPTSGTNGKPRVAVVRIRRQVIGQARTVPQPPHGHGTTSPRTGTGRAGTSPPEHGHGQGMARGTTLPSTARARELRSRVQARHGELRLRVQAGHGNYAPPEHSHGDGNGDGTGNGNGTGTGTGN
jgi:hypothetical protein